MPCTYMDSGRLAVSAGSFCRREPAAALRGLANGALPSSTRWALTVWKSWVEMKISPRISIWRGISSPRSCCGMVAMVATLWVTSSPVVPSPRVAARTRRPSW